MPPAVRLSDKAACPSDSHGCPGCPHPTMGPAIGGSTNVFVNKKPAIRLGDPGIHMACCGPNMWKVAKGSGSVYVNGKPVARLGDKTTHCGGDGKLISASPNVFIDDGASGSMLSKLLKALEQAARAAVFGKLEKTKAGKALSWAAKAAKLAKAKKGKAGKKGKADAKDGKGPKAAGRKGGPVGKGKDAKQKKAAAKKRKKAKARDHSKESKDAQGSGGIVRAALPAKAARPRDKVPFEITMAKGAKGPVEVQVLVQDPDGKWSKGKKTTVTAKGDGKALKGSFVAPDLGKHPKGRLAVEASAGGKRAVRSNEITLSAGGVVIRLYEEDRTPGVDRPVGTTPRRILNKAELERRGITGAVRAEVRLANQTHVLVFNDDGEALLPPGTPLPGRTPPGQRKPFPDADVKVKITAPPQLVGFSARAFTPGD